MTGRVLIDVHHSDLMESLHRLFEDRLGLEVHCPSGMEWKRESYWDFGKGYPDGGEGVARQFLLMPEYDDLQPQRKRRLTTLEEAQALDDWVAVVCSVPDNEEGYSRFAREKGARYVVQVGNVNQWIDMRLDPLVLDATGQYGVGVPFTPEFDLEGAFAYKPPLKSTDNPTDDSWTWYTSSFVNLFPLLPYFDTFQATAALLPRWEFATYGHEAQAFVKPVTAIAHLMGLADFGWQDKVTGDGFGYVLSYWAAIGRPVIGHASHYRGQHGERYWEHLVTCIDLDQVSPVECARLMEEIVSDPPRHEAMCRAIRDRIEAVTDYEADAVRIAEALGLKVPAAA